MSKLSLNRQENPDLCFKCKALLLGQLWQFLNTLSVLSGLEKKKKLIISENVNVSTQERMVSSQPTRLIFPLCWVWFRNSFLGKSSAVIFLLPAKWITSLHPLSTSPSLLHFQKKTHSALSLVYWILVTDALPGWRGCPCPAAGLSAVSFRQHLRFIEMPANNLLCSWTLLGSSYRLFTHPHPHRMNWTPGAVTSTSRIPGACRHPKNKINPQKKYPMFFPL